jgi:hypothetical protein
MLIVPTSNSRMPANKTRPAPLICGSFLRTRSARCGSDREWQYLTLAMIAHAAMFRDARRTGQ